MDFAVKYFFQIKGTDMRDFNDIIHVQLEVLTINLI